MIFLVYIAYIVFCVFLIYIILKRRNFVQQIDNIPGPATIGFLGNLNVIFCSTEKLWHVLRKLSNSYSPIYRIWACHIPSIFITSAEDAEVLISSTKHIEKSRMYELLHSWLGFGLLTSAGTKWHSRRKLLTQAFHFSILRQFFNVFSEQSDLLIDRLKSECEKAYTNIVPQISQFTLNSICETAMGIDPEVLEKTEEGYRQSIYDMGNCVIYRIVRPWLYFTLSYICTSVFWKQRSLIKYLHSTSLKVIQKRKIDSKGITNIGNTLNSIKKKRLAMLDLLIAAQKNEKSIDDEGIREEVDTFMFEGHDTSAMCICFTLMLIACHEDVQEKIRKEILDMVENSNEKYSLENIQELKYLEMVIKESLRLYPSVPLISRVTSEDVHTSSGYFIPKNVISTIMIYDIHHNPDYFPDPEKFDPDRFLPENCKNRHAFAYIPFSAGPRNCIGQKFAMLEVKIVIAKIIEKYKLLPIDTPDTIRMTTDILLRSVDGIKIKFEENNA